MTFLPIVARELGVRSRQGSTYWTRAALAFLASQVAVQSFLYSYGAVSPAQIGQGAFLGIAWMAQMLALGSIIFTADALSSERRAGTLGLLFLTDLRTYDVVLGKMASAGLGALYALICLVPSLALPMLAGGVTGGEVARHALAVLNTLFVALALGMWISARSREQMGAFRRAAVLLPALWLGPLIFQAVTTLGRNATDSIGLFSPQAALSLAPDTAYRTGSQTYWLSLLAVQVEAWVFLWAACRQVRTSWRDEATADAAVGAGADVEPEPAGRQFMGLPLTPEDILAAGARRQRWTADPLAWVVAQMPGQRALLWVAVLLALAGRMVWLLVSLLGLRTLYTTFAMVSAAHSLFHFASLALVAWVACRGFFELRRTGTLEVLMATPRGAAELVTAQWRRLRRLLIWPMVVLVLLNMSPWLHFLGQASRNPTALNVVQLLGGVSQPLNAVLEVMAVVWVAMWFGLSARRPAVAVAWTVGLVVGLPWVITSAAYILGALGRETGGLLGPRLRLDFYTLYALFIMPVLMLGKNLFFLVWAQLRLRGDLRRSMIWPPEAWQLVAERLWRRLQRLLAGPGPPANAGRAATTGILCLLACATCVLADGAFIAPTAFPKVRIPDQRALIHFANGTETLAIESAFSGQGTNFAWVIPVPAVPKVQGATSGLFPTLQTLFQPTIGHKVSPYYLAAIGVGAFLLSLIWNCRRRGGLVAVVQVMVFWLLVILLAGLFLPTLATTKRSAIPAPVQVLDRKTVGLYDTATLSSSDGAALLEWLNANGFGTPTNFVPALQAYAREGWCFVASRINLAASLDGPAKLHPLTLVFKTERPVYPLRLTGIGNDTCRIDLYVFGPGQARHPDFAVERCAEPQYPPPEEIMEPARLAALRIRHPHLRTLVASSAVATKLTAHLRSDQMQRDAYIDWAPFQEKRLTLYSTRGAALVATNVAVPLLVLAAVLFSAAPHRSSASPRILRRGAVAAACAGAISWPVVFLTLPRTEVTTAVLPAITTRNLHQHVIPMELETRAAEQATKGGADFRPDVEWVRKQLATDAPLRTALRPSQRTNPFSGQPWMEEDSPGNYALRQTPEGVDYLWYNLEGAEHVVPLLRKRR